MAYIGKRNQIFLPSELFLPFEGNIDENNRWCEQTVPEVAPSAPADSAGKLRSTHDGDP